MQLTMRGELSPEKARVLGKLREQELSLDKQSDAIRKMISTLDDRRTISSSKHGAVRAAAAARDEAVGLTSTMCEEMKGSFSEPSVLDPFDHVQPYSSSSFSQSMAVRDLMAMRAARDEALKDRLMQRQAFLTSGVALGSSNGAMDFHEEDVEGILKRRGKRSADRRLDDRLRRLDDGHRRSDDGHRRSDDEHRRSDDGYRRFQPSGGVRFDLEPPLSRVPSSYYKLVDDDDDDAVSMSQQQLARLRTDREMVTRQRLQDRKDSLERMHLQRLRAMEEARHGRSMAAALQLFAEVRQRTAIRLLWSRRQARAVLRCAVAASAWRRVGICFALLSQRTIHRRVLSATAALFRSGLAWRRFMSRFRRRVHVHLQEMTRCVLSYSCRLHRFFLRFHQEASVLRRSRRTTRGSIDSHRTRRACARALSLLQLNVRLFQRYDAATMYYADHVLRRRLQSALEVLIRFAVRRRRQRMVEEERRWEQLKSSFASWLSLTAAHHGRAASVKEGVRFASRYALTLVLSRWQHRSAVLRQLKRSVAVAAAAALTVAAAARGSSSSLLLLLKRHRWLRRRVRELMHSWAARIRLVRRRLSLRVRWMRHVRRKHLHRWLSRMRTAKRWHGSTGQLTFQRMKIARLLHRWLSRTRHSKRLQQLGVEGHLMQQSASTHLHRWHSNVQRSRRLFIADALRSRRLTVERVAVAAWHGAVAAKMARRCSHRRLIRTCRLKRGWVQFCRHMQCLDPHSRPRQLTLTASAFHRSTRRTKRRALLAEAISTWQLFIRCRCKGRRRTGRCKLRVRTGLESRAERCLSRLRAAAVGRLSRRRSVSIGITRMHLRAFKTFRAVLTRRALSSRRARAAMRCSRRSKAASLLLRWGRATAVLAAIRRRHKQLVGAAALGKKACALRWWCERCRSGQRSGWMVREASMHHVYRSLRLHMWLWRTHMDEQMRLWEHLCRRGRGGGAVAVVRGCVRRRSLFGRWQRVARLGTGRRLAGDAAAALRDWKLLGLSFHRLLRCAATKDIQDRAIERYRRQLLVPMLQRRALEAMRAMLVSSRIVKEDVGGRFSVCRSCRHVLSLLAAHRRKRSSLQCDHVLAVRSHRRWQTESAVAALRRLVAAARGHARARANASSYRLRQTVRPVLLRWRERTRTSLRRTAAAQGARRCLLQWKCTAVLRRLVSYRHHHRVGSRKLEDTMAAAAMIRMRKYLRELHSRARRRRLCRAIQQVLKARREHGWKAIIFGAFREAYRQESKVLLTVGAPHWSRRRTRTAMVSLASTVRRGRMRTVMHRRMHLRTVRRHFRASFLPLLQRRRHGAAVRARADQLRCQRVLRRWMMMMMVMTRPSSSSTASSSRTIVSSLPAAIEVMMRMQQQQRGSEMRPMRSRMMMMMMSAVEAHCRSKRAAQVLARWRSAVEAQQHTRIAEIVADRRMHLSLLHDSVSRWIRHCSHATSTRLEAAALLLQGDHRRCGRGMTTWRKWFSLRCFSKYGGVHYMRRLLSHHLRTWTTYTAVHRHHNAHDHSIINNIISCSLSSASRQQQQQQQHSLFDKLLSVRRHLLHWRRWNEAGFRSFRTLRHSALHYLRRLLSSSFRAIAVRGKLVRERFLQARTFHTTQLLKRGCAALVLHRRLRRDCRTLKRRVLRRVFSRWANASRIVLGVGRIAAVIARVSCSQWLRWAMHQWSCDVRVERLLSTHLLGLRAARGQWGLRTISAHAMSRRGQRLQVVEGVTLHRRRLLLRGYAQWQQRLLHTVQCYKDLARTGRQHHRDFLYKKAVQSLSLRSRGGGGRRGGRVALALHRMYRLAAAVAALRWTVLAGRHRRQQASKAAALLLKSAFHRLLLQALKLSQDRRRSGEGHQQETGPWQQLRVRTDGGGLSMPTCDVLSQRHHMMQRQCFSSLRRLCRQRREERRRHRSGDQHFLFLGMRDCFKKLLSHCRLRGLKRRNSGLLRQHWLILRARQAVSKLDLNATARWARKSHLRLMSMHSSSTDLRRGLLAMRAGSMRGTAD